MFYRQNGRVFGVLMDWDHALARDPVEVAKYDLDLPSSDDPFMKWVYQYRRVRYWYTRPYIDIERQSSSSDEMPPHRYEHDLEERMQRYTAKTQRRKYAKSKAYIAFRQAIWVYACVLYPCDAYLRIV